MPQITGRFADIGEPDTLSWLAARLAKTLIVFEASADLSDITPIGSAYGASLEADDHALERTMNLPNLGVGAQTRFAARQ